MKELTRKEVKQAVIEGYRKVVENRYQYADLKERYALPPYFDEARVHQFRDYFLAYIYPPPAKRETLDEAFDSLDDYIKQPSKLLRILMDSGRLIFKYGRHLPKILSAGLKALRSFRTANRFEQQLVEQAILSKKEPPFDVETVNAFITALPKAELEDFIESSRVLFLTLHDRVLVKKITEIVEFLIAKMRQRPDVYAEAEIQGLEIGRDIIKNGDALFDQLPKERQEQLFKLVVQLERDTLEALFA
ncbi:MAG: hypothetical protein AAF960_24460 [Bacteroidota bacterium]